MPKIIGLSAVPRPEGISGEETLGANRAVDKRLTQVYDILADNVSQTEDDILATPGLPLLGDVTRGATCKRRSAQEVDTAALLWSVTCDYDSRIEEGTESPNPEDRPPKWSWSFETVEELIEYDAIAGKKTPIENSAREPFLITTPVAIPVLTVEKIQLSFDPDVILNYVNHTNSTTFWGAPEGAALMSGITDDEEIINGAAYRKVIYTTKFRVEKNEHGTLRKDTWAVELLDHGTRYYSDLGLPLPQVPFDWNTFRDKQGNPTTGNLDGQGSKLFALADPVYLTFNRYPKTNLNGLQLGPF